MASAHTEAMHLAQALGPAHANDNGLREHVLARAEELRGLVRKMDQYMLPAQQQNAGHANAALADRLLRRSLMGPRTRCSNKPNQEIKRFSTSRAASSAII